MPRFSFIRQIDLGLHRIAESFENVDQQVDLVHGIALMGLIGQRKFEVHYPTAI